MREHHIAAYKILSEQQIVPQTHARGRGHVMFPEFLELTCSKDGTRGDCLIYPDTPENRKRLVRAKCRYNSYNTGQFAGIHFVHRYETHHHGEQVIVIQRIV